MNEETLRSLRQDVLETLNSNGATPTAVFHAGIYIDMYIKRVCEEMRDTQTVFYQP